MYYNIEINAGDKGRRSKEKRMKPSKKTQKKLDARIDDYSSMMNKPDPPDRTAYHCPGSRKKIY